MKSIQIDGWRIHLVRLFNEVLENPGTAALEKPLQITMSVFDELAKRASEINDPRLNKIMLRLTLYDIADPYKYPDQKEYSAAMDEMNRLIKIEESVK